MGLLSFMYRHPVATVGGVGTAAALSEAADKAKETEARIMAEQLGTPEAKYSELNEFLSQKKYLEEKLAFYKKAEGFGDSIMGGLGGSIGSETAKAGIGAIGKLISGTTHKIHERLFMDARRRQLLDKIVSSDPIISVFERNSPGSSESAYATMIKVAPTLSMDPNIVTSFLRNAAQSGGPLDYHSVKLLADAELSARKAVGPLGGH
jgi:hypothetical protein